MIALQERTRVESFGERLRGLRLARGLSCAQLAHRVGVTEGAIRQMESGQTKMASFVIGLRLAKELGTDAWYLANGVTDDPEARAGGADAISLRVTALEQRISKLADDRTREP
ncbi:MAG: Helix-turn-helix domain [Candidatus Eremiobacteraeota bacterium]|jgi:transcriptional regulator with XRE-family HTH domain|nr:Helix-turn-helix domain [Candidatus Eremiobacteraeota bacterium]MEA2721940.1 Helix-turn-helix domain [Candidatus Eremiobacteraeota bacterium]